MAIGIRIKLPGVTQEQFDTVHDRINPSGARRRDSSSTRQVRVEGAWGAIDFWESREDFDTFQSRITVGMAAAGIAPQGPPDIKEFPVHETISP